MALLELVTSPSWGRNPQLEGPWLNRYRLDTTQYNCRPPSCKKLCTCLTLHRQVDFNATTHMGTIHHMPRLWGGLILYTVIYISSVPKCLAVKYQIIAEISSTGKEERACWQMRPENRWRMDEMEEGCKREGSSYSPNDKKMWGTERRV